MFPKLIIVVLTLAGCACWVLALRQSRILAAHDLAQTQLRVRSIDERLWTARTNIAQLVTPEHVGVAIAGMVDLKPFVAPAGAPGGTPAGPLELTSEKGAPLAKAGNPSPKPDGDGSLIAVEHRAPPRSPRPDRPATPPQ